METIKSKIIYAAILIVLTIITGIWLHQKDRPLNAVLFNLHKFISLGAIVFMVLAIIALKQSATFANNEILFIVLTAFFLVISLVSGGILSAKESINFMILMTHRIATVLVLASGIYTYYSLILSR